MNSIAREALIAEVHRRGWTFETLDTANKFYRVTDTTGRSRLGRGGRFMGSSANGVFIAINKSLTYEVLGKYGFKMPPFVPHRSQEESEAFVATHGPVVVKPADGQASRGVSRDVMTVHELAVALDFAAEHSKTGSAVLQKQLTGNLYRVTLIGPKVFAVAHRRTAFVTGDGVSTVAQLIDHKNEDPRRSHAVRSPLLPLDVRVAREILGDRIDSVPADREDIEVGVIPDLSHGGESADVTDKIHPDLADTLVRIAGVLGLEVAGFDVITTDISVFDSDAALPVLEVNTMPGYNFHLNPTAGGIVRNPAPAVLDLVFGKEG